MKKEILELKQDIKSILDIEEIVSGMSIIDGLIHKYDIKLKELCLDSKNRDIRHWKYERVFYILTEKWINLL